MLKSIPEIELKGTVAIPPSKSDCQRALLAAALAKGKSVLHNYGESDDEMAMLRNIIALGARVENSGTSALEIQGIEMFPMSAKINAGESGLGVRLLTSILAAHEGEFIIDGKGSLLNRSQHFFEIYLPEFGAEVKSTDGFLPLIIKGPLVGQEVKIDGSLSSQFLSGLLMALPLSTTNSVLVVDNLKSFPYVQMTLDTLEKFGIEIENDNFNIFRIKGNQKYSAAKYSIESDWSSASYWLVAAAIGHDIRIEGLNPQSLQADRALLDALDVANCFVTSVDGQLTVDGNDRRAFEFDATHCPDLFPALVTLAAFCEGTSTIKGVSRLATKESDRGLALQEEFGKLGLEIELNGDIMSVNGGQVLHSNKVHSHRDHRIAMCLAIAGTKIAGGIEIEDAEAVGKSYPGFWDDLEDLM